MSKFTNSLRNRSQREWIEKGAPTPAPWQLQNGKAKKHSTAKVVKKNG